MGHAFQPVAMRSDLDLNPLTDFELISTYELNQLIDHVTAETWLEELDAIAQQDDPVPTAPSRGQQ